MYMGAAQPTPRVVISDEEWIKDRFKDVFITLVCHSTKAPKTTYRFRKSNI